MHHLCYRMQVDSNSCHMKKSSFPLNTPSRDFIKIVHDFCSKGIFPQREPGRKFKSKRKLLKTYKGVTWCGTRLCLSIKINKAPDWCSREDETKKNKSLYECIKLSLSGGVIVTMSEIWRKGCTSAVKSLFSSDIDFCALFALGLTLCLKVNFLNTFLLCEKGWNVRSVVSQNENKNNWKMEKVIFFWFFWLFFWYIYLFSVVCLLELTTYKNNLFWHWCNM